MKIKRRRVLTRVLTTLMNVSIAFARHPARNSGSVYRAIRDFRELQDISDEQLKRVSKYVVGAKYVTMKRESAGIVRIELTLDGRRHAQGAALQALKPLPQVPWDRKWRIVIFDIPNHKKKARDGFAATLKRLGFLPIQKSVFIFPYPCEEELEIVADYFEVSENIDTILASRISRQAELLSAFELEKT